MTSQPRERERDLRGVETREAAEGNEVIWNKSNCFGKKKQTLIHSCFSCGEMREGSPGERSDPSAAALSQAP